MLRAAEVQKRLCYLGWLPFGGPVRLLGCDARFRWLGGSLVASGAFDGDARVLGGHCVMRFFPWLGCFPWLFDVVVASVGTFPDGGALVELLG